MRKLLILVVALATMAVAASPALAQSAAQEQYSGDSEGAQSKTFDGYATSVGNGDVVVSQDPSLGVDDPGYCDKTIDFGVTADTRILTTTGGDTVPASADDLRVGQEVRVDYTEDPDAVYPAICPPQREADAVIILPKGDNPPDGGGNGSNGGVGGVGGGGSEGGGEGGSGSSLPGSEYNVLPDTGGGSLVLLAAGVALVACGLVAVRRARLR